MADKVRNGTLPSEHLCITCKNSVVMEGESGKTRIQCHALSGSNPFIYDRIVKCSAYEDKRNMQPSLRTMTDMAFIITEQGPLKTIGFVPSRLWRKTHKDEEIIPNMPGPPWD